MSDSGHTSYGSFAEPNEIMELSILYDFYGPLLKDKHREIFEDYVWNNLSLGEIANEREITRQGVYDVVRRCRIRLREYEEKLRLVYRFQQTKKKLEEIVVVATETEVPGLADRIMKLTQEIHDIM